VVGKAPGLRCTLSDREFEQPDYEIRKCAHCFILYRTPNLSANELSAYYSLVDYRKWEIPGIFPTERAVRQKLLKLREGARVLDFGCSSGRLLAPLVGRLDCYGFEINAESARAAAEKGLKMISQNAIDSGSCRMFDAIVLCDVFEHLSSPTSLLARLVEMLEPAGTLIVVTGNADSSACIPDPANFWYFRTVEHLCMMNRKHAEFIEQELKLKLTDWITLSHYDSSLYERAFQWVRHVAYWEFRGRTFFGRRILPIVPYLRRARQWKTPPIYTASDDHVVAVFEKL
jgi:SAM-dependent methyltransferase